MRNTIDPTRLYEDLEINPQDMDDLTIDPTRIYEELQEIQEIQEQADLSRNPDVYLDMLLSILEG